jgi:hypothetical protein
MGSNVNANNLLQRLEKLIAYSRSISKNTPDNLDIFQQRQNTRRQSHNRSPRYDQGFEWEEK